MAGEGKTWWRAWTDSAHHPKLVALPGDLFKHWYRLLCLARLQDGRPMYPQASAKWLGVRLSRACEIMSELHRRALLDTCPDGGYVPHNFEERQYLEGSSTKRVRRFRKRHETFHETSPEQSRAEQISKNGGSSLRSEPPSAARVYAFEQGVIRLTQADFDRWKSAFTYLDLNAELTAIEPWAAQQQNWFVAVSALLNKHNREAKVAAEKGKQRRWLGGVEGIL